MDNITIKYIDIARGIERVNAERCAIGYVSINEPYITGLEYDNYPIITYQLAGIYERRVRVQHQTQVRAVPTTITNGRVLDPECDDLADRAPHPELEHARARRPYREHRKSSEYT